MSRGSGRTLRSSGYAARPGPLVRFLQDYFANSELPLTGLVFLLPLLVFYEIGTRYYSSEAFRQAETRVLAFTMMRQFMEWFGASGRYLPSLAVVGILLSWHIARRDRWDLQVGTAFGMLVEAALLALPVLALSSILRHYLPLYAGGPHGSGGFVLAVGAGIYEELVFRLIAFTILNILLMDLLKVNRGPAYLVILMGTSVAFAAYHYWTPHSEALRISDFVFRASSGAYFGILFMVRGFAVTAGVHAFYDVYYFAILFLALR